MATGSTQLGSNTASLTASQIKNVPSGNLSSTNVQSALNELQGDIDTNAANIATNTTNIASITSRFMGVYTWSGKPSAASNSGNVIRVTDIGVGGSFWVSDGTRWAPQNGQVTLLSSGLAVSAAADTNENVLATINILAGMMGINGTVRVTALWSFTNSANNKILRIRFGGIAGTQYLQSTLTTQTAVKISNSLSNRNLANSQVGSAATASFGSGQTLVTSAVDTTADTTLIISGQKATAGETLTLEQIMVELLTP